MASAFGRDTSCTTSLRPGRLVTGLRFVAEAMYRRVTTPRGTLRGGEKEANYGIDLAGMVGSIASKSDIAALPGRIRLECLKDDRASDVTVTILEEVLGPATHLTIAIHIETDEGGVTLTLAVSAVTVAILGITED